MRILLATHRQEIDSLIEKLENEKSIKELEKILKAEGMSRWARPLFIVDSALYRERLIEKALKAKPDVILLYDKLPGAIELDLLLEEIRLEVKNQAGHDTRVILLTSLEQGAPLLRKAVEIGVWDIISGQDIHPLDIIRQIYHPANYSAVAHLRLAPTDKGQIKLIPQYVEKEKIVEVPVEKEVYIKEIIREKQYVKVGTARGLKESVLVWSSYQAGKTFLAVNLAAALAGMGLKTVLVDTDWEGSGLESHFLLEREERFVLLKALKGPGDLEQVLAGAHVYRKNLTVLSLPMGKKELPEVSMEEFLLFYDSLRVKYDFLVLDGCRNIHSPLTQAAMKVASRVLVVVTQDLFRVKLTRQVLKELEARRTKLEKFEAVLNFYVPVDIPEKKEIAEILEMELHPAAIPAALEAAYRSTMEGVPAIDYRRTPEDFVSAVRELARALNGSEGAGPGRGRRNLFSLFRGGKL